MNNYWIYVTISLIALCVFFFVIICIRKKIQLDLLKTNSEEKAIIQQTFVFSNLEKVIKLQNKQEDPLVTYTNFNWIELLTQKLLQEYRWHTKMFKINSTIYVPKGYCYKLFISLPGKQIEILIDEDWLESERFDFDKKFTPRGFLTFKTLVLEKLQDD